MGKVENVTFFNFHGIMGKNMEGWQIYDREWKNITQQFKCPIRKNKLENQKIYQSIYGIV